MTKIKINQWQQKVKTMSQSAVEKIKCPIFDWLSTDFRIFIILILINEQLAIYNSI